MKTILAFLAVCLLSANLHAAPKPKVETYPLVLKAVQTFPAGIRCTVCTEKGGQVIATDEDVMLAGYKGILTAGTVVRVEAFRDNVISLGPEYDHRTLKVWRVK